jgi:hypothetical protein
MDLNAGADALLNRLSGLQWESTSKVLLFLAVMALVLYALRANGFVARAWKRFEDAVFSHWQLVLLGTAALVLSLAGGYTTWDGMTNFTGEPVLSLMFTFGIHGVMLIVAWLIGESFASGMNTVPRRAALGRFGPALIALVVVAAILLAAGTLVYTVVRGISSDNLQFALFTAGAILLALAAISLFSKTEIVAPYIQAARIIAKNAVLWVMFLACMATSVFFSFDSRFNVVFPAEERKRVADLRAQNQVTGILADIEATITARRIEQARQLFESDGWHAYDNHLATLAREAQGAQAAIESYFVQLMEERRRAIAQQQERIATAQSGQAGLAVKKISLTEEYARLKGERPALAADYNQHKSELDAKQREVDAKRIEALAEDRGVEGTGKQGRGPVWRERMAELGKLQDEYKIKEERTKDAQKRLASVDTRIAQIERELSGIDGELAKLKGEADTAEQRIRAAQEVSTDGLRIDPARVLLAFETARGEFRQEPTAERLAQVQQLCSQLHGALANTPLKDKVRGIDCDPKKANEAAAVLFALNAGAKTFETSCSGGERLAQHTGADALFGFARKCLADSGLPSKDTDALRTKISFTEFTRDDRAHRFVVSWNAFNDGNRLAYLALAIAIGIDSLIFMTGLFGANALRSPLADVPSSKARNSQQLEAIIENALLPDKFDNAALTLEAMQPISALAANGKGEAGFTHEVVLPWEDTPAKHRVLKVLNAGATIGAVERDGSRPDAYLVRPELFEFLSIVAKKEFDADAKHATLAELERIVAVALLPDIAENADLVLSYMDPIEEQEGFTAEIDLGKVAGPHLRLVRSALNAAATVKAVQRGDDQRYLVSGDLYRSLARLRARLLASTAAPRIQADSDRAAMVDGGRLQARLHAVSSEKANGRQITHEIRTGEGYNGSDPQALHARVLDALLGAIDVSSEDYERLRSAEIAAVAASAGQALQRLADRNEELRAYVRYAVGEMRGALERERTAQRGLYREDAAACAVIDQVYRSVSERLPALLLLPQIGFLNEMIRQLEQAAASDDGQRPGEQPLLDWLRHLDQSMKSADLSQPEEWRRIEKLIQHVDPSKVVLTSAGRKQLHS